MRNCEHAASGCNAPQGECLGLCMPLSSQVAAELEVAHGGKVVKEVWPHGRGIEIVFSDNSSLTVPAGFVFHDVPQVTGRKVK